MRYEFGPFRLDTETLVLLREEQPVPITPKALQILRMLVENAGRVVGKDELLASVWDDLRVEEGNLTQNIFSLRRILGEKPKDHRFIVTVPGKGYRFVAELRPLTPSPVGEEPPSVPDVPQPAKPSRLNPQARFVLLALLIGGRHNRPS
jgi:DNA-binding winged helix-turn-helix (wHTH) protein